MSTYRLRLLGGASVETDDGPVTGPIAQRRRLALLALLAASPTGAMGRDRLAAFLFPEADTARAHRALSDALHAVRRVLGRDAVVTVGDELRLDPELVPSDVAEFERAAAAGEHERAAALYRGPFLDAFAVPDAPELERWTEDTRQRLARRHAQLLEAAAEGCEAGGDAAGAARWWRRLAEHEPYSSPVALRLASALDACGDPAGALRTLQHHAARLRDELEIDPGPEVHAALDRLARAPRPASPNAPTPRAGGALAAPPMAPAVAPTVAPTASDAADAAAPAHRRSTASDAADASAPAHRRSTVRRRTAAGLALVAALVLATTAGRGAWLGSHEPSAAARPAAPTAGAADATTRALYERGRLAWSRRTPEGLEEAVADFRAVIERAPADARAYVGLADAYVMLGYLGFRPAAAMFPKGKAAALRALALDPSVAGAHAPLGQALAWERRWGEAERAFREAIRRDPRDATAHQWYATMLAPLGRVDEAVAETGRAAELDPLSLQINNMHGMLLHYAGRSDESLRHYRRFVEQEPDTQWVRQNPWLLSNMSRVLAARGLYAEALRAIARPLALVPRHPRLRADLATIYAAMGERERALRAFAAADTANGQYPFFRAELFAALREPDSAFRWLDRVTEWGPSPMGELRVDPRLASIRADPRYARLLARLGLTAPRR